MAILENNSEKGTRRAQTVDWSTNKGNKHTFARRILSKLSVDVREQQYRPFEKYVCPAPTYATLDIGMTPDESLVDSNYFERRYPFPDHLTAASAEAARFIFKLS